MLKAYSYAKLNLFLYVTSKRKDGYHNIYSLITRINLFDYLSVEKNKKFCIETNIEDLLDYKKNILFVLYRKIKEKYNITPCRVILYKNIPIGAGLGGGSSNLAVFLELLIKLYNLSLLDQEKISLLGSISADAPYFLHTGHRIISGIGDIVSDEIILPKFYILLVKPPFSIMTKHIYESGRINITEKPPISFGNNLRYSDIIKCLHNDLERAVFFKEPCLAEIKKLIKKHGADDCLVTGSGSALFGIFSSKSALMNAYTFFSNNFPDYKLYKVINIL
jgi:4-diphosphocytidyl-2-C-methyl-D-erythritol kinase